MPRELLVKISQTSIKHQFKVSVKHQLVSVCFYMKEGRPRGFWELGNTTLTWGAFIQ